MDIPIAETPVLEGKDAERFLEAISKPHYVSREKVERRRKVYEYYKSIASFPLP